MKDDITYCASDCESINCKRNKANITDWNILHSFAVPKEIPDCPRKITIEPDGNLKGTKAKFQMIDEL